MESSNPPDRLEAAMARVEQQLRVGAGRPSGSLSQDLADLGEWDVILGYRLGTVRDPTAIREAEEMVRIIGERLNFRLES